MSGLRLIDERPESPCRSSSRWTRAGIVVFWRSFLEWAAGIRQFIFIGHEKSVFHCFFLLSSEFLSLSARNLRSDAAIFDAHDRGAKTTRQRPLGKDHWAKTTKRRSLGNDPWVTIKQRLGNLDIPEEKAQSGVVMGRHYSRNWVIQDNSQAGR